MFENLKRYDVKISVLIDVKWDFRLVERVIFLFYLSYYWHIYLLYQCIPKWTNMVFRKLPKIITHSWGPLLKGKDCLPSVLACRWFLLHMYLVRRPSESSYVVNSITIGRKSVVNIVRSSSFSFVSYFNGLISECQNTLLLSLMTIRVLMKKKNRVC